MDKFERSLSLAMGSWRVLWRNKTLFLVPVGGFAVQALFLGIMAAIALATGGLDHWVDLALNRSLSSLTDVTLVDVVLLTGTWMGTSFIAVSSSAVLMGAVFHDFERGSATIRDGLEAIRPRLGNIVRWSIIAGAISLVLNLTARKGGVVGWVVSLVISAAWAFATLFVIPVLVLKDVTPWQAMRESMSVFKRTWGENFIGGIGIGLAFLVPMIAVGVLTVAAGLAFGIVGAVIVGVPAIAALITAQSAVGTVFNAALYQWATGGNVPEDFGGADFRHAFVPKEKNQREEW